MLEIWIQRQLVSFQNKSDHCKHNQIGLNEKGNGERKETDRKIERKRKAIPRCAAIPVFREADGTCPAVHTNTQPSKL